MTPIRAVAFMTLLAVTAPLQASDKSEMAKQPVSYYALTPEVLMKFEKATKSLNAAAAEIRKLMPRDTKSSDDSPEGIIAALAAECEKVAPFKSAVEKAKSTCRDYALTSITLMQASMFAFGVEREGEAFYKRIPDASKTLRANVKFAKENKAKIVKINAEQRKAFE